MMAFLAACETLFIAGSAPDLWVFLSARNMAPGRFMFFNRSQGVAGHRLFVATRVEDFYQRSLAALADEIDRLVRAHHIQRIFYWGFSAGAFAAVVLGSRSHAQGAQGAFGGLGARAVRTIAFAPQYVLDQPLTNAARTLDIDPETGWRVDPAFRDIRTRVEASSHPIDLLHGAYEFCDGMSVSEAVSFKNPNVHRHILRCKHNVGQFCADQGVLESIFQALTLDEPVSMPASLYADAREEAFARHAYDLAKRVEHDGLVPDIPALDDVGLRNPDWWNIKSRVRARHGDWAGAMGDVIQALVLEPTGDGHHVCAGHYARSIGLVGVAKAFYQQAAVLNTASDGAWLALAQLAADEASQGGADGVRRDLLLQQGFPRSPTGGA